MTDGKVVGMVLISVGYGFIDLMLPSVWAMCLDIGERFGCLVNQQIVIDKAVAERKAA